MKNFIKQNIILSIIFLAANAYSAALEITPDSVNITSMQPFTMDINVKDAVDLYGAGFDVTFDTGLIRVVEVREGTFLKEGATQTSFLKQIDNQQGRVVMGITRLGQVSGVNGSGTLATVVFKPISTGTATLRLSNIILQDSSFDSIPVISTQTTIYIPISSVVLRIEPCSIDVPTNQDVTIRVMIDKVVELYGTSFDILFNPSLLEAVNITEGNFLKQDGLQTAFLRTIDNKNGRVIIGISRLEKVTGISGSGTLCSITFKTKNQGIAILCFDNICLKDSDFDRVSINSTEGSVNIIPIKLKVDPCIKEVKLNQECELNIVAEGVNNLFGAAFDLIFNPDILEAATVTEGNFLNQDGQLTHFMKKVDGSRIIIGIARLGQVYGVSGAGVLCKIIFNAKAEGRGTLSFENIALNDPVFNLLGVSSDAGTITIVNLKAGPIKCKVTKADGITPVKDANVELIEMNKIVAVTTTQATGECEFNNLQAGDYELKVSVPAYNIYLTNQIKLAPDEVKTNINFSLPETIVPYPNPANVSEGQKEIFFQGLPAKSKIKIYSIAGELVKTINDAHSWNLKNDNNEEVASGVYIYVVTNDAGLKEIGKIGVIK